MILTPPPAITTSPLRWRAFLLAVALALGGCATIDEGHKPAAEGWPDLEVREHTVGTVEMVKKCYDTLTPMMKAMGGIPFACAWVDLCAKTCDIYVTAWSPAGVLEHERLHCRGHDHVGDDGLAKLLAGVRANPLVCKR